MYCKDLKQIEHGDSFISLLRKSSDTAGRMDQPTRILLGYMLSQYGFASWPGQSTCNKNYKHETKSQTRMVISTLSKIRCTQKRNNNNNDNNNNKCNYNRAQDNNHSLKLRSP